MDKVMLVFALVVSLAGTAAGQCCGDCGGDGQVTINDLIVAVNNALIGCDGAPTPTVTRTGTPTRRPTATPTPPPRCPFDFETSGGGSCGYRGRYNRGCGTALNSALLTNGTTAVVVIDTMLTFPRAIYFGAEVVSDTRAELFAWSTDNFQTSRVTAGDIELTGDGTGLVVFPNFPPFMIQSCDFVQYDADYTGHVGGRQTLAAGGSPEDAFERLRQWRERPIPEIAD